MAENFAPVEPSKMLVFPFQDQAWIKKLAITSGLVLISFIPVLPLALLLGYLAKIIHRIAVDQQGPALPEWDDLTGYFSEGIKLFGIGAVYLLPAFLLIGMGYLGMFFPVFLAETAAMGEGEFLGLILASYLGGFGLMGIGFIVSMATGLILPVAGTHAVVRGNFQAAFNFREIWAVFKANWGGFLVAYLIMIGAAMVLYYISYLLVVTVILCCIYPLAVCLLSAYLALLGAGLFGEAYRAAQVNLPGVQD